MDRQHGSSCFRTCTRCTQRVASLREGATATFSPSFARLSCSAELRRAGPKSTEWTSVTRVVERDISLILQVAAAPTAQASARVTTPGPLASSTPSAALPLLLLPEELLTRVASQCDRATVSLVCKAVHHAVNSVPVTRLLQHGRSGSHSFTATLTTLCHRHASSLTVLDLRHAGRLLSPSHLPLLSRTSLPHLASFTVHRCATHLVLPLCRALPLPQLTHLELAQYANYDTMTSIGTRPLLLLCTAATNLRSLSFSIDVTIVYRRPANHTVLLQLSCLQRLTRLELTSFAADAGIRTEVLASNSVLAATARLPALQSLTLGDGCRGLEVQPGATAARRLHQHTGLTHLAVTLRSQLPLTAPGLGPAVQSTVQAIGSLAHLQKLTLLASVFVDPLDIEEWLVRRLTALRALQLVLLYFPNLEPLVAVNGGHLTELTLWASSSTVQVYEERGLRPLQGLAGVLKVLRLRQSTMSHKHLQVVAQLTALTELVMSVGDDRHCSQLDAEDAALWAAGMAGLSALPGLQVLRLHCDAAAWSTDRAETAARVLGPLTDLVALELADCGLTDEVLQGGGWLVGLQQLRLLDVSGNGEGVRGAGLQAACALSHLRDLSVTLPSKAAADGVLQFLVPPPPALLRLWLQLLPDDVDTAAGGNAAIPEAARMDAVRAVLAPFFVDVVKEAPRFVVSAFVVPVVGHPVGT